MLINKIAPNFTTPAILGNGKIVDYNLHMGIRGRFALVFFYPMDFTFACPTALIALNHRYGEFSKRDIEVVTVSVDSVNVHKAWRDKPTSDGSGIGKVQFTMASDITHSIMRSYDVEYDTSPVALRAAFIIDRFLIKASIINDLPFERSVDHILYVFDELINKGQ